MKVTYRNSDTTTIEIETSEEIAVPKRLLKWLFGDFCEVLVLTPGKTVGEVEIHEVSPEVKEDAPV